MAHLYMLKATPLGSDPGQVHAAGAMLDDEEHVQAAKEHGVDMEEVRRQDGLRLSIQERSPGLPGPLCAEGVLHLDLVMCKHKLVRSQLGSSIFIGLLLDTEPAASLLLTCTSLRLTDLIHRAR